MQAQFGLGSNRTSGWSPNATDYRAGYKGRPRTHPLTLVPLPCFAPQCSWILGRAKDQVILAPVLSYYLAICLKCPECGKPFNSPPHRSSPKQSLLAKRTSSPFGKGKFLSLGKSMLEAFGHLTRTTIGRRCLGQGLSKPCQVPQGLLFGAENGQGTRMQTGQPNTVSGTACRFEPPPQGVGLAHSLSL